MNVKTLVNTAKRLTASKYLMLPFLVVLLLLAYNQWQRQPKTEWQADHVEIGLRRLGDQLLRKYGDEQTPVPPIAQAGNKAFSLNLPNELALSPDFLAEVALETFDASYFRRAIVQVYTNGSDDMVYGFNIDTQYQQPVPCLGRELPQAHYQIKLKVLDPPASQMQFQVAMMGVAGMGLLVLMLSGFIGFPKTEKEKIEVAGMQLDVAQANLHFQGHQVKLTQKECKLALIFMKQPGKLVTRDYLTEEVWAKEGVITGRSLDVFISRLRKKMAINPQARIVNEHGKGYMLEVV